MKGDEMRVARWVLSLGAATVLTLVLLAGWGGASPARQTASIKVGLITKTDTNPFFVKMKQGAQKQAKELGVQLLTAAGKIDGDAATQITAIQNMVSAGVPQAPKGGRVGSRARPRATPAHGGWGVFGDHNFRRRSAGREVREEAV